MNDNRCVCCGRQIPEGRMVCPICEKETRRHDKADYWLNEWILPLVLIGLAIYAIIKMTT